MRTISRWSSLRTLIDKKLFQRAIKDRKSKQQDKIVLAKIDEEYEAKVDDLKGSELDTVYLTKVKLLNLL